MVFSSVRVNVIFFRVGRYISSCFSPCGQVRVNVWDTAGQERFNSLLPAYCRGAHGALFVFDLTDLRTFLSLDRCLQKALHTLPDNVCKVRW